MAGKTVQKEALEKLFEKMSEQAFKQTFVSENVSENLQDNITSISSTFAKNMASNAGDLFDIIDNLIDVKLSSSIIIPKLSAPNGPVTGEITIKGT